MSTLAFYQEQAARCTRDAEATNLSNVKERHLRSRDAWLAMAERLRQTADARAVAAAQKAATATAAEA